jgi:asparagine N-glycosylation enzyme membrane subunit Stt3
MDLRFWHKKWLLATVVATVTLVASSLFLVTLKVDYDRENDAALHYFSQQPGMPDAFTTLEQLTPSGSVVLCWWDYDHAVREWSHREVIEAYPSREIANTVGSTRSFWGNVEGQLFGTWGSSEKIRDIARIFMLNEEQALPILKAYNVSYALVFTPDELEKFYWIAQIAVYNSTDYLTHNTETDTYEPTARGEEVTLLRLLFDDAWRPRHFTKLYDNDKAKIYRIDY